MYLSHHPLLWSLNNTDATPSPTGRDLFKELLDAIHGEGLKVIAYMAGQGAFTSLPRGRRYHSLHILDYYSL